MKTIFLSLVLIFVCCNGTKKASAENNDEVQNNNTESLTLILRDNYSGSEVEETLIIRDMKALKSFYARINRTRKPGLPLPNVDFEKEMILIHCSGNQSAQIHSNLSILEKTDDELVLKISEVTIGQEKKSSIDVSPFIVYKMPLIGKKISFKKIQ